MITQTTPDKIWEDPLCLLKQDMGPDMVISYAMSCAAIRDIIGGKVFLDVGGWGGELLAYSATFSGLSLVLNILRSHLKAGQARPEIGERQNIGVIQGDAQHLPLCSGSIDVVLTAHTLEHVPDYRSAVSEMKRLLKEGGDLIVILPNGNVISGYNLLSPKALFQVLVARWHTGSKTVRPYADASADGPTYHGWLHDFDSRLFCEYLESQGFHILKVEQGFYLFSGILRYFYLLPDWIVRLAPERLKRTAHDPLPERSSLVQQGESMAPFPLCLTRTLLRMPRRIVFKMNRFTLMVDALEQKIFPWRQGGVFLIHARKISQE